MRLSPAQIKTIGRAVTELAGADASVHLFGSRLDDSARGGDIDLLAELPRPVAQPGGIGRRHCSATRAAAVRKVDVLLGASNLQTLPIRCTLVALCPTRSAPKRAGTDSSSRMRIARQ